MRKVLPVVTVLAVVGLGAPACGHKVITSQLDALSNKVESMSQSLEQTQERTRQNEAKITQVDARAGAAQSAADGARTAAATADQKAVEASASAMDASNKVDALGRRLVYTETLSEAQGGFEFNKSVLPAAAMARLDALAQRAKSDPKGAYFDVEGHTDNVGTATANMRVGLDRANAVKRYLYEKHQIPLYRINVISYGADKPMADNQTKEGRAQNRRVVIKVWQ